MKSPSDSCGNCLNGMLIWQKLFGRWISLRGVWIAGPCSAIHSPPWISYRQHAPSFGKSYRHVPISPWSNWKGASARHSTPKRPTTWCQAEIPKTFKHPTSHNLPPTTYKDRKSTRLNSSHGYISYAVFCLKKKNKQNYKTHHINETTQTEYAQET